MMPQFAKLKNKLVHIENIALGLFVFSIGLFKKVVIADTFALWATQGFDISYKLNMLEAWMTSLSYTFQLYFDFSGYTDMAMGAALFFNIKLPINFNSPYKATNIQDFWRRWHITLSRFLKNYVYIPLGGNRKGRFRTYNNLMATFVIGGIWHGAGWTFVFWGFLHGMALIIQKIWNQFGFKVNSILAWFITFNFINITWVFFRAKEWRDAVKVLRGMFSLDHVMLPSFLFAKVSFLQKYGINFGEWLGEINGNIWTIFWLFGGFILILFYKNSTEKLKLFNPTYKNLIFLLVLFLVSVLNLNNISDFLYFNF